MKTMHFRRGMRRISCSLILFCTPFLAAAGTASAAIITVPPSLNPGDQYCLVFVTSTTRDATSTNIADYNTFVTNAANSVPQLVALPTIWKVIGSTSSLSARDNTGTNPNVSGAGVPFYILDGSLVASGNVDFWDGSHLGGIHLTETGVNSENNTVFTGTSADGTSAGVVVLGSSINFSQAGGAFESNSNWIGSTTLPPVELHYLYGMSGLLTVVPEPGSMVMASLAAIGLVVSSLRQRRQCKASAHVARD